LTGYAIHHTAARIGNLGFLLFSIAMLITSIFTYIFVASSSSQLKWHKANLQSTTVTSTIAKIWTTSHILHAMTLALSLFVSSWRSSLVINICMGISFSITQFAPFTILGEVCASPVAVHKIKVETGTVMALHNAAIASPQLVAAGICALVFKAFRVVGFDGSEAWAIGLGAIPAMAAAWQAKRLWQDSKEHYLADLVV
jgi:solute carrier family 45 protein 1/2/4